MALKDIHTTQNIIPLARGGISPSTNTTYETDVFDTKDTQAFTFVTQVNTTLLNPASSFVTTNAQVVTSDDSGFSTEEVVTSILGDINEINKDWGVEVSPGIYIYRFGIPDVSIKRYLKFKIDIAYGAAAPTETVNFYTHGQYEEGVSPASL